MFPDGERNSPPWDVCAGAVTVVVVAPAVMGASQSGQLSANARPAATAVLCSLFLVKPVLRLSALVLSDARSLS
jgi:hypothetical protein